LEGDLTVKAILNGVANGETVELQDTVNFVKVTDGKDVITEYSVNGTDWHS
jgi:hypothetical protein